MFLSVWYMITCFNICSRIYSGFLSDSFFSTPSELLCVVLHSFSVFQKFFGRPKAAVNQQEISRPDSLF